ncbi:MULTISPECIES: Hsp20/alpha crystallin family protein [Halorussus]|uniref:Hsp20/alpha crystallin family protein n=1 Tax=Halorussus TaxID=1070314 RepID=UPI000E21297B|nr:MULTISPECIES: Hsp20/alpha crystallin family protein [Halorussus]NHN60932.1 Hsp20/alpha crystallin family protein [Halorussus sp. JP-T4]
MSRYGPFEEMDRVFEQLRTRMWTPDGPYGRDAGALARGDRGVRMEPGKHGGVFGSAATDGSSLSRRSSDGEYVFVADLPGFEREEIDLSFDDDALTLTAESETGETTADDEGGIALRGEVTRSRRVSERVAIPEDVVEDEITASYRNGVLEVHLPLVDPVEADDDGDDATKIDIGE